MNDKFENQKEKLISIKQEISLLYQQVNYLLRNEKPIELLDLDVLMNRTHTLYDQLCSISLGDEALDEDLPFDADAISGLFGGMVQDETPSEVREEPETEPEMPEQVEETPMPSVEEATTVPVEESQFIPIEETLEVPAEETPNVTFEETPTAPVIEENQAVPIEETMEVPVEEMPTVTFEETSTAPVEVTSDIQIEETQAIPVEESLEAPVEETPNVTFEEVPTVPAEITSDIYLEENQSVPVEETASILFEEAPTATVEETPFIPVEETQEDSVEETPVAPIEDSPIVPVEEKPIEMVENQSVETSIEQQEEAQPVVIEEPAEEKPVEEAPLSDEFGLFFRFEDNPAQEEVEQPAPEPQPTERKVVHMMEAIPEDEIPERDRVFGDELVRDNPFEMPEMENEKIANQPAEEIAPASHDLSDFFDNDDAEFEFSAPETLGDKMRQEDHSLAAKLQQNSIPDLRSAIGINDKFLFVNELFGGSMEKYNKSIENLNDLKTLNGAMIYLNELKIELQWNSSNVAYQKLKELVTRKFD